MKMKAKDLTKNFNKFKKKLDLSPEMEKIVEQAYYAGFKFGADVAFENSRNTATELLKKLGEDNFIIKKV